MARMARRRAFWAPHLLVLPLAVLLALFVRTVEFTAVAAGPTLERVSVSSSGAQGNGSAFSPILSGDGRFVAFTSNSTNLLPGDGNGVEDAFVRDLLGGTTTRVSITDSGGEPNGRSFAESISDDGRYVAFESEGSNLVSGDTNGLSDLFVRDRQAGTTVIVSVSSSGQIGNGASFDPMISGDGRYVAFMSRATNLVSGDTNGADDVFVHDLQTGQTERVSVSSTAAQGLGSSSSPNISSDGRYVVFSSSAINLVSGDTNLAPDVFVRDRQIGVTTLVSVASDGTQGSDGSSVPDISADGRWVVFFSAAGNLVSGDSNSGLDVFVHDRQAGATSRVSVATGGQQAAGAGGVGGSATAISDDGRYVAFHSDSSDLVTDDTNAKVDVFVHD